MFAPRISILFEGDGRMKTKQMVAGILSVSAIMLWGTTTFASGITGIEFEARQFRPDMKFNIQSDSIDYHGGAVNFKDDLGIKDTNANEFRLHVKDNLRLAYTKLGYSGNSTLTDTLQYDGVTYNVGANIDSKFDMTYARVTLLRPITSNPVFDAKWLIDIKGFKLDTRVHGQASGGSETTATEKVQGVIPTLGFAVNANINPLGVTKVYAEVSGLPMGKYGHLYDIEAGIKHYITPFTTVNVGYRALDINVKDSDSDEKAQLKLSGPYFGASFKF